MPHCQPVPPVAVQRELPQRLHGVPGEGRVHEPHPPHPVLPLVAPLRAERPLAALTAHAVHHLGGEHALKHDARERGGGEGGEGALQGGGESEEGLLEAREEEGGVEIRVGLRQKQAGGLAVVDPLERGGGCGGGGGGGGRGGPGEGEGLDERM